MACSYTSPARLSVTGTRGGTRVFSGGGLSAGVVGVESSGCCVTATAVDASLSLLLQPASATLVSRHNAMSRVDRHWAGRVMASPPFVFSNLRCGAAATADLYSEKNNYQKLSLRATGRLTGLSCSAALVWSGRR